VTRDHRGEKEGVDEHHRPRITKPSNPTAMMVRTQEKTKSRSMITPPEVCPR
jgi:hypothetical protein